MMQKKWLLHHDRFIHSAKTALAVAIGYAITQSVHFPVDQWLVITIIVVMCAQINVGSMIQKSYMRFLGTMTGSLIAITVIAIFHDNPFAAGLSIVFAAGLFSYLATSQKSYSDSGTLGAVTVVIILFGKNPTIATAAGRFLEISLGILIAAAISQFVFPIHARYYLRHNQAKTLHQLRNYYLSTLLNTDDSLDYLTIDESVAKALIAQRKLAIEATTEPLGKSYNIKLFKQSLACEKEILRSITFMSHSYHASASLQKRFSSMPSLKEFHEKICIALESISTCLGNKTSEFNIALPPLQLLQEPIQAASKILSAEDIVYADSFLFSAQVLLKNMAELITLIHDINQFSR